MAYLALKDITFQYPNKFTAVEDVSLSIEKGERVAIIGQNGAGKTTTVKMMNGLLKPTEGEVMIDGESTKGKTTAQISRKIGYVFQNPDDQIFHNNILNEIRFGPKILGFDEDKTEKIVDYAVELTGLSDVLDENPYNVPISTRKFITIASVIAMDTEVIILDEPTAGQDMHGIKRLEALIDTLQKENKTVITITHDMEFVIRNFERVIVMAHKNVLADTTAREVFWSFDLLEESMLQQPSISKVAHETALNSNILYVDEILEKIETLKK